MNDHLSDPGAEQVARALAALRDASAGARAPDHLEAGLVQSFRSEHKRSVLMKRTRRYAWIAGAIAASLAVAAAVRLSKPQVVNAPEPRVVAQAPTPAQVVPEVRNEPKPAAPRRARRVPPVRRQSPVVTASAPMRREVTTDFFAIPYAPALTQVDRGQLIRVNVPATSMRSFGLPVSEDRLFDRVQADVLMGEDGIARAIRFVRQQNSGLKYR